MLLPLAGALVLALACGASSSPAAGTACASAKGTCILGGAWCAKEAAGSAQDCNPDDNPGGAYCCLALEECTVDASMVDSGSNEASEPLDASGEASDSGTCAVRSTACVDCVTLTGCNEEAVACALDDAAPIANCGYQYGLFASCVCNVQTGGTSGTDALGSCEDEFAAETNGMLLTCIMTACAGQCLGAGEP